MLHLMACLVCFSNCDLKDFPLKELEPIIKLIAIEREWIDIKEHYTYGRETDVLWLRSVRRDTYDKMPRVSEGFFIPPLELLQEWLKLNLEHQEFLELRGSFDRSRYYIFEDWIYECVKVERILIVAISYRSSDNSVLMRKQYLQEMYNMGINFTNFPLSFVPLDCIKER